MPTETDNPALASELARSQSIAATAAADSPNPEEGGAPAPQPRPPAPPEVAEPAPLERITAGDRMRTEIAARFKAGRGAGIDFHGDMSDPMMRYGQYGAPAIEGRDTADGAGEPGIPAVQIIAPAPDDAPPDPPAVPGRQLHGLERVVVNGVEMWLTPDQLRTEAQKSLAAANILDTAKQIKDAVSRSTVSRPHQDDDYPPRGTAADAPGQPVDPNQDPDPYADLVRDLQFGDPAVARQKLRDTIATDARAAAQEVLVRERFGSERSHRIRALAAFQASNPDLAADPYAPAVITSEVNRQYVADLKAIGVPDDLMPRTAAEIADWHMQARVQGKPVRDIGAIFETAKTRFTQWRGGPRPNPTQDQPQPARPTAPRVELSPDRTQRRANVPVQPTRASAPIAQPISPATPGGDRSAAIMAMRKARGQIVA